MVIDPIPVWRSIWQADRSQLDMINQSYLSDLPADQAATAATA